MYRPERTAEGCRPTGAHTGRCRCRRGKSGPRAPDFHTCAARAPSRCPAGRACADSCCADRPAPWGSAQRPPPAASGAGACGCAPAACRSRMPSGGKTGHNRPASGSGTRAAGRDTGRYRTARDNRAVAVEAAAPRPDRSAGSEIRYAVFFSCLESPLFLRILFHDSIKRQPEQTNDRRPRRAVFLRLTGPPAQDILSAERRGRTR